MIVSVTLQCMRVWYCNHLLLLDNMSLMFSSLSWTFFFQYDTFSSISFIFSCPLESLLWSSLRMSSIDSNRNLQSVSPGHTHWQVYTHTRTHARSLLVIQLISLAFNLNIACLHVAMRSTFSQVSSQTPTECSAPYSIPYLSVKIYSSWKEATHCHTQTQRLNTSVLSDKYTHMQSMQARTHTHARTHACTRTYTPTFFQQICRHLFH